MKTSNVREAIKHAYNEREPIFLHGSPGIGKSQIVAQAAEDLGLQLIDFRIAQRDPTDIKGFPMPDQKTGTMKFFRDAELPTKGRGILFFDELNSGTQATQAAAMQLTLKDHQGKHRIGDYELPEGWSIVAAGNLDTDRGVTHRMPTPLANRFTHLMVEVDPKGWVDWALDNGISSLLIAFIRFKEDLLFKFDPKIDSKAFPTPRSWARSEKWMENPKISEDVKYDLLKGTVGDGPGAEYMAFRKLVDELPTIDEILKDPKKAKLPAENKLSAKYAITTLMGANASVKNFEPLLEYGRRMPAEFQCVFVRDALRKDMGIRQHPKFVKWAADHGDLFAN